MAILQTLLQALYEKIMGFSKSNVLITSAFVSDSSSDLLMSLCLLGGVSKGVEVETGG